jgi:hypothetical protein
VNEDMSRFCIYFRSGNTVNGKLSSSSVITNQLNILSEPESEFSTDGLYRVLPYAHELRFCMENNVEDFGRLELLFWLKATNYELFVFLNEMLIRNNVNGKYFMSAELLKLVEILGDMDMTQKICHLQNENVRNGKETSEDSEGSIVVL